MNGVSSGEKYAADKCRSIGCYSGVLSALPVDWQKFTNHSASASSTRNSFTNPSLQLSLFIDDRNPNLSTCRAEEALGDLPDASPEELATSSLSSSTPSKESDKKKSDKEEVDRKVSWEPPGQ